MATKQLTPEEKAQWEAGKRLLRERVAYQQAKIREAGLRNERRRRRIRRLTFGFLGGD